jgi:hypothetical protein
VVELGGRPAVSHRLGSRRSCRRSDWRPGRRLWQAVLGGQPEALKAGATHPDTLGARANLAYFTGEAGDPAAGP